MDTNHRKHRMISQMETALGIAEKEIQIICNVKPGKVQVFFVLTLHFCVRPRIRYKLSQNFIGYD